VRLSALRQGYTVSPVGRLILFCPKEQQLHQRSPPAVARESGSVWRLSTRPGSRPFTSRMVTLARA